MPLCWGPSEMGEPILMILMIVRIFLLNFIVIIKSEIWCSDTKCSLVKDKLFHHTFYDGCNYLSLMGLKLKHVSNGVGLLNQLPLYYWFFWGFFFSISSKRCPIITYHGHICQVSPQLSCGDTWQIWPWFMRFNLYCSKIKKFCNREINERSLSNPHPDLLKLCFSSSHCDTFPLYSNAALQNKN